MGGSQCSPVSECLRGNLFRSRERRKDGGVEYKFHFRLLGQNHLGCMFETHMYG